jgi:hypothetical protein
MKVKVNL